MFVGVLCECSRTSGNVGRMVLGWHLDRIRRPVQNPRSPQDHWLLRHHVGTYPKDYCKSVLVSLKLPKSLLRGVVWRARQARKVKHSWDTLISWKILGVIVLRQIDIDVHAGLGRVRVM